MSREAYTWQTYKDSKHELGWNCQQVCLESREAHLTEDERQVVLWRLRRDVGGQADQVQWPQVVVLEAFPKAVPCDCLAVVHVTLTGVVSEDTVDQDCLLSFIEPSVLATEPALRLANTRWHKEPRCNANTGGDSTFNQKQPYRNQSAKL